MLAEQQALIYEGCAETVLTAIESLEKESVLTVISSV